LRVTDLGGHSGCKILLCENGGYTFVRKISKNLKYNERLMNQANKQKEFRSNTVIAPKVLKSGIDKQNLFYFDMEYIQGVTLSEYIKNIEIGKIQHFVNSLVDNIMNSQDEEKASPNLFVLKINSLENQLSSHNNLVINDALKLLKNHSWNNFKRTNCHGDLTLENIIIKDNKLYLIDFLDSFYDSNIMDLSTLMQDVQTMWAYRKETVDINTIIRLIIFRDILIDKVKKKMGKLYIEVYYALLLKLIRIYPYTNDPATYDFLNDKTKSITEIIKKERSR
jgi:tRNA A-37 threonylcarbamoyl transferase component Bud32